MLRAPQKDMWCPSRQRKEFVALKGPRRLSVVRKGTVDTARTGGTAEKPTRLGVLGRWLALHGIPEKIAGPMEARVRMVALARLSSHRESHLLARVALAGYEYVGSAA